jgi:hypothetical protein
MLKQEKVLAKKPRGRPATGRGETIGVRMQPADIARVDAWRKKEEDLPSRPEAIRRLLDWALKQR